MSNRWQVTFEFEGSEEEVGFIVDRIIENYNPLWQTELKDGEAELRKEYAEKGFGPEQIDYLVDAQSKVEQGFFTNVEELQEELGFGVVDAAVLKDTFFNDDTPEEGVN